MEPMDNEYYESIFGSSELDEQVSISFVMLGFAMYVLMHGLDLLGYSSKRNKHSALAHLVCAGAGTIFLLMGYALTICIHPADQSVHRLMVHGSMIAVIISLAVRLVLQKYRACMTHLHVEYINTMVSYEPRGPVRPPRSPRFTPHTNHDRPLAAVRQPKAAVRASITPPQQTVTVAPPPPKVVTTTATVHHFPTTSPSEPVPTLSSFYSNVVPSTSRSSRDPLPPLPAAPSPVFDSDSDTDDDVAVQRRAEENGYVVMTLKHNR